MSSFVLNRNYQLQLPNIFVEIDRKEMEYVDGGGTFTSRWYGWDLDLSASECGDVGSAFTDDGINVAEATAILTPIIGKGGWAWGTAAGILGGLKAGNLSRVGNKLSHCNSRDTGATLIYKGGVYSVNPWKNID